MRNFKLIFYGNGENDEKKTWKCYYIYEAGIFRDRVAKFFQLSVKHCNDYSQNNSMVEKMLF